MEPETTPAPAEPASGMRPEADPDSPTARTPLSRDAILAAALRIADSEGLDALSMRRLGSELGVDPMAIYHHVANKAALFDAMTAYLLDAVDITAVGKGGFLDERLTAIVSAYRVALLTHPGALPLLARGSGVPEHAAAHKLVRTLEAAGMGRSQTQAAAGALLGYAVGATAAGIEDDAFAVGAAALIRGLAGASVKTPKKDKSKDKTKKKDTKKGR